MLEIRIDDGGTVFLSGRFDAAQLQMAEETLDSVHGPTVADFSGLEYISSAGIGVILKTYKRLHDAGHPFRIINMSQRIRTVFQYAGLDRILLID